jgi:hydrogenase nickel incorporation protein HypB
VHLALNPNANHQHDGHPGHGHSHHDHDHHHSHSHGSHHEILPKISLPSVKISLEERVLAKNDQAAEKNRAWLREHGMKAINMISSPGAGKTYLLEKTLERLVAKNKITILTGDLEKDYDASRLAAKGGKVKQLNTISSCHLDASMIARELGTFVEPDTKLLVIENVGNLVCPAAFDLGEHEKVALLSTTEGEDKPSKYPLLFHTASLIVITKTDLIPYLDWSLEKCITHIRNVNPTAPILELSAKTGEGMDAWIDYLMRPARPA